MAQRFRISQRNWERAKQYTSWSLSSPGYQERVHIIVDDESRNTALHEIMELLRSQYFKYEYGWDDCPNLKLRCSLKALPPFNSRGTAKEPHNIELQPIEKLRCRPLPQPLQLAIIAGEMDGKVYVLGENEGELCDLRPALEKATFEQGQRTRLDAEAFIGKFNHLDYATIEEVEAEVDEEIERLITEQRLRECFSLSRIFSEFPKELRSIIWGHALNLEDRIWPGMFPEFEANAQSGYPYGRRPMTRGLLAANKELSTEAIEALYSSRIFAFVSPAHLKSWLKSITSENLLKVRRIEVFLNPACSLKFVQAGLDFIFALDDPSFTEDMDDFYIEDLFRIVSVCPKFEIIFQMPALYQMPDAFNTGPQEYDEPTTCCHFTLCKWLVKGVMKASEAHERVRLTVKTDYMFRGNPNDSGQAQVAELMRIKEEYATVDWENLGVTPGTEVLAPPECWCPDILEEPDVSFNEPGEESTD